jgi:pimeloyl-ACP methyl ester carboxylesterase
MAKAQPPSLSFRQSRKGGEILDPPAANPGNILKIPWHLILLIHGYNNNLKDGRDAYEGFRRMQKELGDQDRDRLVTGEQMVDIYWPGDADWGIFSPLYYMGSIDKAKRTAASLAEEVGKAVRESGFKFIDIVAHSMGCRLTLEFIKHLASAPDHRVHRIAFMAAAVPTFMFDPTDGNQLRTAYDTKLQDGAISLFSPDDMVLSLAFPFGQTLAGEGEGWFPTALGHNIWQSHLSPSNLSQHQVFGAGHSDYWGWNNDTLEQARQANRYVREFLRFYDVGVRELLSRLVAERQTAEDRTLENYSPEDIED